MIDNGFVKSKLNELENIRASLQGKIERNFVNTIALITTLILIVYFVYVDIQEGGKDLYVLVLIIGAAYIYLYAKMKATDRRIDTIIKLLDLEKLAEQKYTNQIKEIANTPQTS